MRNIFRDIWGANWVLFNAAIALLIGSISMLSAQPLPEQDCASALPVCGSFFQQPTSYSGTGTTLDLADQNGLTKSKCLQNAENNSVWYIFTVTASGMLEFTITPSSPNDDYDFALFNISGGSCSDIGDPALEVRCNFKLGTGTPTGLRAGYTGTIGSPSGDDFLAPLAVSTGETYALVVDNFSSNGSGYTLDFLTSSASIVDNTAPLITNIESGFADGPFTCDPVSTITVYLSEPVICSSIDLSGADFSITGPANVNITGVTAPECAGGAFARALVINLDAPLLVGGTYTFSIAPGSIEDNCTNTNLAISFDFDVPDIVIGDFTYSLSSSCIADTFTIENLTTGNYSTIEWDFGDGTTDSVPEPVHVFPDTGTYDIEMIVISADNCRDTVVQTVQVNNSFSASIQVSPLEACVGETINFTDVSVGTGDQYWWDFGDNTTSTNQNETHVYTTGGTYEIKFLLFDNSDPLEPCPSDTIRETVLIRDNISAGFTMDNSVACQQQAVQFTDNSTASPVSWAWDFGDSTTSTDQNPSHVYTDTGTVTVKLVVVDEFCGTDSTTAFVNILTVPEFSLGNDTAVCFSEEVILVAPAGADSYNWSTAETGEMINVTEVPQTVTLEVTLNGCAYTDTIVIDERLINCAGVNLPGAFSPNDDGKNDRLNVITKRIDSYKLMIYNRWGKLIFQSNQFRQSWDGTYNDEPQEIGTYIYVITAVGFNGEQFFKSGNVTLIR